MKRVLQWLLVLALTINMVGVAHAQPEPPRAHPALLQLAQERPNEKIKVIVQRKALEQIPPQALARAGGKVTRELPIINGFAMELPARAVEALARSKGVRWISIDAPVQSAGTTSSCTPGAKVRYNAIASGQFTSTYYGYTDPWNGGVYNPANVSVRYRYESSASTHPVNILGGDVYLTWSYKNFTDNGPWVVWNEPASGFSRYDHVFNKQGSNHNGGTASIWPGHWSQLTIPQDWKVTNAGTSVTAYGSGSAITYSGTTQDWVNGSPGSFRYIVNDGAGDWRIRSFWFELTCTPEVPNEIMPRVGWQLYYVNSQEIQREDGRATNAFDGDPSTMWVTQWGSATPSHTHEIWLDLGKEQTVTGFEYTPRQDGNQNGRIADYDFWVKTSSGWVRRASGRFANDSTTKRITFPATTGRYVALRAFSEVNGGPWTSIAELNLLQPAQPNSFEEVIGLAQLRQANPNLTGQNVTVAVVDSGIANHNELKNNGNGSSRVIRAINQSNAHTANDDSGHGTHVAGIVGGNGASTNGVRKGVAPGVNLVSVKVSNDQGVSYLSDVVEGLQWIYENKDAYNIRVVNLSLNSTVAESYHVSPLSAAIEILWFNGVVVVTAVGNNGSGSGPVTVYPPANDPFAITVGATDDNMTLTRSDDVVADFSAYGTTEDGFAKPDLVAPGRNIISLLASTTAAAFTQHPVHRLDNNLFRMSGTSMAAPVVTGAIALLLQDEPNLTPDQVKYRLKATANKNWSGYSAAKAGAGYVDIYAAVTGSTWQSANTGIAASQMLFTGNDPVAWDSVSWNSVSWNSVSWNSVSWNSVSWNSVSWNATIIDSCIWDDGLVRSSGIADMTPVSSGGLPPIIPQTDPIEVVANGVSRLSNTIFLPLVTR